MWRRRSGRRMRSPTWCTGGACSTVATSASAPSRVSARPAEAPMTHWELPAPHVVELNVQAADIDAYGHVNNSVYLTWLDRAAWAHSAALGMPLEDCLALRRGMAAQRIEIEYLRAAVAGDQVLIATWIVMSDGRLRCARRFQAWRAGERAT